MSIDGGGKGLRRLFWGLRSYGNSWCGGPKRQQFRWTSAIEAHHRRAQRERFGHGETRLVMEGGVEEHSSGGNGAEQSVTVHATLEPHSVGNTPSMRSARNPPVFRTFAKDAQHDVRVTDVAEGANSQSSPFPREQARCEHDIASPGARWMYFANVN